MAGISTVFVALLAASQVSAENTRASVLAAAASGATDGVSTMIEEPSTVRKLLVNRVRKSKDRSRVAKKGKAGKSGKASPPAPPPESSGCGTGGQPVCSGDDLDGREFECDYGFVGDNGMCVPWEEEITSTPTTLNSNVSPQASMSTDAGTSDVSSSGSNDPNCGTLGGEMCSDGSCKEDYVPVNLGGTSTICRKPEEAAAQLGQSNPAPTDPTPTPTDTTYKPADTTSEPADSASEPADTTPADTTPADTTPTDTTPTTTSPAGTGSGTGAMKEGHITHFDAMGTPHGGCGVPSGKAFDDNGKALPFVALNTNTEFDNGSNCGRWIEITLQENCDGGYNDQWEVCVERDFVDDEHTGEVIYAYTMDSCADPNFWCQNDADHLDLSTEYLRGLGLIGEHFNARIGQWQYMNGAPSGWSMSSPKYMWMDGSRWLDDGMGFFAALIVYNTDDGIAGVEMLDNGSWKQATKVTHLGNVWEMPEPSNYRNPTTREFTIRVKTMSGDYYGQDTISFTCGNQPCSGNQDA